MLPSFHGLPKVLTTDLISVGVVLTIRGELPNLTRLTLFDEAGGLDSRDSKRVKCRG